MFQCKTARSERSKPQIKIGNRRISAVQPHVVAALFEQNRNVRLKQGYEKNLTAFVH